MKNANAGLSRTIFLNLILRVFLLIVTSLLMVYLVNSVLGREMVFTLLIGIVLILIQAKSLTDYVLRINRSLVDFIDSVGYTEESQLKFKSDNAKMSDFELRVNQLLDDISHSKVEGEKQKFLLENAIDEMEHGLICVKNGDDVIFSNRAFRKLTGGVEIGRISELDRISPELAISLKNFNPVVPAVISLGGFKASLRRKEFKIGKDNISLYSIQDIQQEIDKNEIESWERLIQVLTHEIMNSLSPIISLSKSMQRSIGDPERILTGLSTIENTGEGLINFISEYRKLSDLPMPEKQIFGISKLFEHISSLFARECEERKIILQAELEDQDLKMYADMFQVEQVLVNLVTNSMDALSGRTDGIIRLMARSNSDATEIVVEDNGPGIEKNIQDKIFIPFFSTKKKGVGIGLSLSKQIITNHTAVIQISSEPGKFSRFTLRFGNK